MSFFSSNRDSGQLLALLLAPVMLLSSCLEVVDDGSEAMGYLAPVSVSFDLSIDEVTETKALALPQIEAPSEDDILVVVKDKNGNEIHSGYGMWDGTLVVPIGNYTVEASYGTNGFGQPYFYGSVGGSLDPYENEQIPSIKLKVSNSLAVVNLESELSSHFTPASLSLVSAGVSHAATLGEYCFVPAGRMLSVRLEGTNSMGNRTSFSYDLSSPEPGSAYEVTCGKASADWPTVSFSADNVVAWATRIYITSSADFGGNISTDNKEAVVYEAIPASSSDWSQARKSVVDNGIPVIKGLATGTEYKVRARAGVLVSPEEVKVTPVLSGLSVSAEHTSTSGLLDGTDVKVSFAHSSSAVKSSIKSWSLNVCKPDGTVLRSGLSIGVTSDGSQDNPATGWPYLPSGEYKIVAKATMTDGEVNTAEVSFNTGKPTFTVSASAYTSYNKYLDRNLDFANNAANKNTVFERKTNVSISDALLSNPNYAAIRSSSITFNSNSLGTFNTNTKDFGNDANCTSWQNYPFKSSMTFDGVTKEASVDCHITGLPYNINFATTASGWTLSDKCTRKDDGLHFDPTATPYANLSFYIPTDLDVSLYLYSGVQLNATSLISIAHLDVKIGSKNNDKVLTAPSKGTGGKTTTTTETEVKGTLGASASLIELKTNGLVLLPKK